VIEPHLRAMLARADSLLRQGDSGAARSELEAFAREHPSSADSAEFHAILAQA